MTANAEIQTTSDDQATAVVSQRRLSEPATAESARKTSVSCSHCGLPVPRGLIQLSQQNQFCCNGCRVAYQIIHENGLTAYYSMVDVQASQQSVKDRQRSPAKGNYGEFDEPTFFQRFVETDQRGVASTTFVVEGIHCAACVWLIEKLPQVLSGVIDARVNWSRNTVELCWDTHAVQLSRIADSLERLGYRAHPVHRHDAGKLEQIENRRQLVNLGVAGAAAGNNMLITAALYLGMFSYMSGSMETLLRLASCLVGSVSFFWPGRVFLQGALSALKTKTPHMDLPIALGLSVAMVAGLINTFRGAGEIYFDSLSVLVFLLLVGRWIQFRQQLRTSDAIEMLYRMTPRYTRKIVNGEPVETLIDMVEVGDILDVRSGEVIPVDGVITAGTTAVDEAILTGESQGVARGTGDLVFAGTQNVRARVEIRAITVGNDTRIASITRLIEKASIQKPSIVQWADRIGGWFVSIVILLALFSLAVWLWWEPSGAVDRTVALLIVACPCALALATPLSIAVAIGRSASRKIMIKGGDVLQRLNKPGMIWLDKTGTLTEGRLRLVEWIGDATDKRIVSAIESHSSHPVAVAIVDGLDIEGDRQSMLSATNVTQTSDGGILGDVGGQTYAIGNELFVQSVCNEIKPYWNHISAQIVRKGLAPCFVADRHQVIAIAAIGDEIRSGTRDSIERLKRAGWTVGILSGDHPKVVERVGQALNIDSALVHGGVTPEQKLDRVTSSNQEFETVVMVGDGVNDSAALAAAPVGIAVKHGAEACLEAAPIYLGRPGLEPMLELLATSRSTCNTIRTTLSVSIVYNALGVSLAMAGLINPLVAAFLMPISSLTVVSMALGAGRIKPTNPSGVDHASVV